MDVFDSGDQEPNLAGFEAVRHLPLGGKDANLIRLMRGAGAFNNKFVFFVDLALGHANQRNNTQIIIEP